MTKIIKCAYCNGIGKDPFELHSSISNCHACNGTGQIEVDEPIHKCIYCNGSGINPIGAKISCMVCNGKGFNHYISDIVCDKCKGTGKWTDGWPCSHCNGIGFL